MDDQEGLSIILHDRHHLYPTTTSCTILVPGTQHHASLKISAVSGSSSCCGCGVTWRDVWHSEGNCVLLQRGRIVPTEGFSHFPHTLLWAFRDTYCIYRKGEARARKQIEGWGAMERNCSRDAKRLIRIAMEQRHRQHTTQILRTFPFKSRFRQYRSARWEGATTSLRAKICCDELIWVQILNSKSQQ